MKKTLSFWQSLGFTLAFTDTSDPAAAAYCGVHRGSLTLHLQTFTSDQIKTTQTMALRVWMKTPETVNQLAGEWASLDVISAALGDRPWGNREFGLYDPDKTPFFFCASL